MLILVVAGSVFEGQCLLGLLSLVTDMRALLFLNKHVHSGRFSTRNPLQSGAGGAKQVAAAGRT